MKLQMLGLHNVAVGCINEVAAGRGFCYKKMYAGQRKWL